MPEALDSNEICIGLVIHMGTGTLLDDDNVQWSMPCNDRKARPYLCVGVHENCAWWTPTSTTGMSAKYQRLHLAPQWRNGGDPQWTETEQYLLDGAMIIHGPLDSFCRASTGERTDRATRAELCHDGVLAVLAEIESQLGRREREVPAIPTLE